MILLLVACTGAPVDARPVDTGDTEAPDDPPLPDLPTDAAWWEHPGPLDALLLPESVPTSPHWQLRLATRADASAAWEPDPRVLAVAFSSLGVLVVGDRLVVTGNVDHNQANALGLRAAIGTVYALSTTDLETWYSIGWLVGEATHGFVVDPALYAEPDGRVGAVWYATSESGGDPASFPGDHEIRTGHWNAEGSLVEDAGDAAFALPLLADPVICPLGEDRWLFATSDASDIVLARAGADGAYALVTDSLWPGPSVPSCRVIGDSLELLVQRPGGGEPPELGRLDADGTFTPTGALYDEHPWGDNCTSPAIAKWGGREVLVCAVFER